MYKLTENGRVIAYCAELADVDLLLTTHPHAEAVQVKGVAELMSFTITPAMNRASLVEDRLTWQELPPQIIGFTWCSCGRYVRHGEIHQH